MTAPYDGSALVESDGGYPDTPRTNTAPPPNAGHEGLRALSAMQAQIDVFFRPDGRVEQFCTQAPKPRATTKLNALSSGSLLKKNRTPRSFPERERAVHREPAPMDGARLEGRSMKKIAACVVGIVAASVVALAESAAIEPEAVVCDGSILDKDFADDVKDLTPLPSSPRQCFEKWCFSKQTADDLMTLVERIKKIKMQGVKCPPPKQNQPAIGTEAAKCHKIMSDGMTAFWKCWDEKTAKGYKGQCPPTACLKKIGKTRDAALQCVNNLESNIKAGKAPYCK